MACSDPAPREAAPSPSLGLGSGCLGYWRASAAGASESRPEGAAMAAGGSLLGAGRKRANVASAEVVDVAKRGRSAVHHPMVWDWP